MKVVAMYKWAGSPQDATVGADGSVDWSRAKPGVGEYDSVGIGLARLLVDATGGELVGVSVGGEQVASSLARKAPLSRGLDRLVVVADAPATALSSAGAAAALAAVIGRIGGVDVVVAGDASIDVAASTVPALVGAALGWPVVTDASSLEAHSDGLRVVRRVAGGSQTLQITGPVVVAAATDALEPKVPGMRDILASGSKPVEVVAYADLGLGPVPVAAAAERRPAAPPARKLQVIDGRGSTAEAASQLVAELRTAGIL